MQLSPIKSNMTELRLNDGTRVLFSYKTPVAAVKDNQVFRTTKKWSATTTKHINYWFKEVLLRDQFSGFNTVMKDQDYFDNLVK